MAKGHRIRLAGLWNFRAQILGEGSRDSITLGAGRLNLTRGERTQIDLATVSDGSLCAVVGQMSGKRLELTMTRSFHKPTGLVAGQALSLIVSFTSLFGLSRLNLNGKAIPPTSEQVSPECIARPEGPTSQSRALRVPGIKQASMDRAAQPNPPSIFRVQDELGEFNVLELEFELPRASLLSTIIVPPFKSCFLQIDEAS